MTMPLMRGIRGTYMPWDIEYCHPSPFIGLKLSGMLSGQELRQCTSEVVSLLKRYDVKGCLINSINVEGVESIFDLLDLPERQYPEERLSRDVRGAVVIPKSHPVIKEAEFYVTACQNRGWNVRLFEKYEEAAEWLKHR